MTNLKVNNTLVDDLADTVRINHSSASMVTINNSVMVWQREADLPIPPTNFAATNSLDSGIDCTWAAASNHVGYVLYEESLGVVADGISADALSVLWDSTSLIPPAGDVIYTLTIVAIGEEGNSTSNIDDGSILVHGSVTIFRDSYTFTGNGENSVSISGGVGTFTPQIGCEIIDVCLAGGGGGGGGTNDSGGGGGGGGGAYSTTVDVSYGTPISVTIGAGGAGGVGNTNGAGASHGGDGQESSIGPVIVYGGGGGQMGWATYDPSYGAGSAGGGQGGPGGISIPAPGTASTSTCGGTHAGGAILTNGSGGGGGGFGVGANSGRGGAAANTGGGGGGGSYADVFYGGAGGSGKCVVSW